MDIDKGVEEPIKFSSRARLGVLPRLIGVQIILFSVLSLNLATLCLFSSYVWVAHQHISLASTMPEPTLYKKKTVCQQRPRTFGWVEYVNLTSQGLCE